MTKTPIPAKVSPPRGALGLALAAAVLAAALLPASTARAALEIGTTAKVVNVVRAKTLNRRLKLGDKVVYQETVSTGQASAVEINLIDESTLIMGELSEMILDSLVYNPNTGTVEGALNFAAGIFRFAGSGVRMNVTITTPTGTIGIRGTEFDVLSGEADTEVAVHDGTIEVTSAAGTQRVSRGQVYRVSAAGDGGFRLEPSPEMKQAVSSMLAMVTDQGTDQGRQAESQAPATTQPAPTQTASVAPAASLSFQKAVEGKNPENLLYMDLSAGRIAIELRPDLAPEHVRRIKELTRRGAYDGLDFVFVRRDYAAEINAPAAAGELAPLAAELSDVPFERGVVGMSRKRDDRDSAEAQFFITLGRAANLDGQYTAIGRVIHGMEHADRLQPGRPPKNPDRIQRLRVGADVRN